MSAVRDDRLHPLLCLSPRLYSLAVLRENHTSIFTTPAPPFLAKHCYWLHKGLKVKTLVNMVRINLEKLFLFWTSVELLCVGDRLFVYSGIFVGFFFQLGGKTQDAISPYISPHPFSDSSSSKLVNQKVFYQITEIIRSTQWLMVIFLSSKLYLS